MMLNARPTWLILCMAFSGCTRTPDSDVISPRSAKFKPGVTLAVCTTAEEAGPSTIDRQDPLGETLHLTQPPLVTMLDVTDVSLMEAPGQWPIVTVTFDQPTAERFSREAQARGGQIAVLINDEVIVSPSASDKPAATLALRSVFGGPDIRACVE